MTAHWEEQQQHYHKQKVNNICSIKKSRTFCPVIAILVCNTSSEYIVRKKKRVVKKRKAQHPQVISYKAVRDEKTLFVELFKRSRDGGCGRPCRRARSQGCGSPPSRPRTWRGSRTAKRTRGCGGSPHRSGRRCRDRRRRA